MRHAQRVAELTAMSGPAGRWAAGGAGGRRRPGGRRAPVLFTRALTIGGGTTDIQLNIIGERILGLPRDPDPPAA